MKILLVQFTVLGLRHPRESGDPGCKPAFKGRFKAWIPAFAGMTAWIVTLVMLIFKPVIAEPDLGFSRQDGGKPGTFLDFSAAPRSVAMGLAHVGVADDASAVYWNPAGLPNVQRKDVVASYSSLYEDTSYGAFNFAQPTVDFGTFGFGLVNLRSGNFDRRDTGGYQTGTFTTSELAFLFSHGIELNNRWSVGSTIKVIREEVDAFSGTGYGLDGGLMFRISDSLRTGLSVRNVLAPRITLKNEADRYPFDLRLGAQWQALKKWIIAADLSHAEGRTIKPYLGSEWSLNNLLAVRAGINETQVSAGLGFQFNDWGLDYAFGFNHAAAGLKDLGSSHRFGFHFNFGKKVSEQKVSLRWQKKGQTNLAALREKMNGWDGTVNDELSKLINGTHEVIRRQGYLNAADLYAAQGYVSYFEGEYERSVQSFGESLVLDPQNAGLAAHLEKARAQLTEERTRNIISEELKRLKELYEKADWLGTVESCEKVLSFQPDNAEAVTYLEHARNRIKEPIEREMKIALIKFERAEYFDAIRGFQTVQQLDPENKEAADYIARAVTALEEEAKAQSSEPSPNPPVYEIAQDSEQSRLLYNQGLLLYSQGKLGEAAVAWEQSKRLDRQNILARKAHDRVQNELKENP